MKSCWDADPKKRPSIKDIRLTFGRWTFKNVNEEEFEQAEAKRKKMIESKKIGPEFAEKRHSGAIYTSRLLSALISKCSSIYSSSISFDSNYISELKDDKDTESLSSQNLNFANQKFSTSLNSNYISEELKFDILDDESLSSQDLNSTIQNLDSKYISAELELDINTEGLSSQNSSSTIQNFSTSSKKRRNKVGTHDESGELHYIINEAYEILKDTLEKKDIKIKGLVNERLFCGFKDKLFKEDISDIIDLQRLRVLQYVSNYSILD
ncbi:hypothetical protein RhiirA1_472316 [Rhizophagus irregularis]|uniref:Serine-threonine/tyrosine-protein kinase catalytic domain-containing protein n=1 Tax=Rhizophagus irregularis TaxID=588596 RepID=A0A2N0R2L3_9GLOM|nr:hypothetical protein RhiirA1_472316 [Rhizophagus irregularis]